MQENEQFWRQAPHFKFKSFLSLSVSLFVCSAPTCWLVIRTFNSISDTSHVASIKRSFSRDFYYEPLFPMWWSAGIWKQFLFSFLSLKKILKVFSLLMIYQFSFSYKFSLPTLNIDSLLRYIVLNGLRWLDLSLNGSLTFDWHINSYLITIMSFINSLIERMFWDII